MTDSNKDKYFKEFLSNLCIACKNMKDEHYFNVKEAKIEDTDKMKKPGCKRSKYKERVYCYELYHQLRHLINSGHKLDGELDKSGHTMFCGRYKPDFVVHDPGNMNENLAVIEVKPINARGGNLKKDLNKLKEFITEYSYHRGIMLLYSNEDIKEMRLNHIKAILGECPKEIIILIHPGPKKEPIEINKAIEYAHAGLKLY